jgi:DNA-binding CsgD family transcriptional regulator/tetratricopeptide (TPR) repeat protein
VQAPPLSTHDASGELLERAGDLEALARAFDGVRETRRGRLVLVEGEAGVGKTALVRHFCDEQGRAARILWGACDGLFTPHPLAPLVDVAELAGGELAEVVERGGFPQEVAAALLRELGTRVPTVLVLEDLHWADEASLDVFRLVARRAASVSALVVASYREHDLGADHPLRIVLGELATTPVIEHLEVAPLSRAAVGRLARPHGVDPEKLYRKTGGNPFFVTEVLAAGERRIPPTVRDAVLARAARLSRPARRLLEAVAIVPPQAELWMLDALAGEDADRLGECLSSGMLAATARGVAFRHELARLAVEESLLPDRGLELHRHALAALGDPPVGPPDPVRLALHAEAAGEAAAVLEFAPNAAERAASLGAHREAAAQYARALRFGDELPLDARATLLERRAHECYLTDQAEEAIAALRHAVECRRGLRDRLGEGETLRLLSSLLWCPGRTAEAAHVAGEAVALLEPLPPGPELARTYAELSRLCMNADDVAGALEWGEPAIELAERVGDTQVVAFALNNLGTAELLRGRQEGRETLERSLELARKAGDEEGVARAFVNLAQGALRWRWYPLVERSVEAGLAYTAEHGLDLFRLYLVAFRAVVELGQGRWAEAVDDAALVLHEPSISTMPRTYVLVVQGLVRARRAEPEAWAPLDEALALAEPSGELARIAPVAAARAEAAWLAGDADAVRRATDSALGLAVSRGVAWVSGELACWRRRAGVREEPPPESAGPYGLELAGDWARAAEGWTELGCPYEAALALAGAGEEDLLRGALHELQRLGARAAAAIAARRLRERGARDLPRGPRPATRRNPANLTPREVEVLGLVADGLRSSEIAERLFLSRKTVDNHVSAILRKLGARSRAEASAEAVRLGLAGQR